MSESAVKIMKSINEVLPNEVLVIIFEFLTTPTKRSKDELLKIAMVCHQWRNLVKAAPSLQNELVYKIDSQDRLDRLKRIPNELRLNPPNLDLSGYNLPQVPDPFWKSMAFTTITLDLEHQTSFEAVSNFISGFGRHLNCLKLRGICNGINSATKEKFMKSLRNVTKLDIRDFDFPDGIDESFAHLVNLKHLTIDFKNPSWRLPKQISQQLESMHLLDNAHESKESFLVDMINLRLLVIEGLCMEPQVMIWVSQNLPKLGIH